MKHFGIVSSGAEDNLFLCDLLKKMIAEDVAINSYILDDGVPGNRNEKVILVTGQYLHDSARQKFPKAKIIIPERIITGKNFDEVMLLPENKRVYVVNDRESVAYDTIDGLRRLGVEHLQLMPYWPDCPSVDPDIDTSICPDYSRLSPMSVKHVVNIGRRIPSYSSFAELILAVGLDLANIDNYHRYYTDLLLEANSKIVRLYKASEEVSAWLETIFNASSDAIIGVAENWRVIHFNPAAERLLKLKREEVEGQSAKTMFGMYPQLRNLINAGAVPENQVVSLRNNDVLINSMEITLNERKTSVYRISSTQKIQEAEALIRKKSVEKGLLAKYRFDDIKYRCHAMRKVVELCRNIFSQTDLTILLHAESGAGKELFAQSIHNASLRAAEPFVAVNFAALPESLVESELFGYDEGAFTGAKKGGKPGLFETAHKGTIFLDEIGDISPQIQVRLLRVLEEREVMRVGSARIIPVDVRIICATNKNLEQMIEEGSFREDLYYRLKVLTLEIPPLRERKEDIPVLVSGLAGGGGSAIFDEIVMAFLLEHNWPGNVRELKNMVQYIELLAEHFKESQPETFYEMVADAFKAVDKIGCLIKELRQSGAEHEYLWLLRAVRNIEDAGGKASRNKLVDTAQKDKRIHLTEAMVKTRLRKLQDMGLLVSGKTRQGTQSTRLGLQILEKMPQ